MKIVAFLQNPWFRPGIQQRHVNMYRTNQDFHKRVLLMSATGRALLDALGDDLYNAIHWDNANPAHGDNRRSVMKPDVEHMTDVLDTHDPDVIVLFGSQAQTGFDKILGTRMSGVRVLRSPHPMAMGSAREHLHEVAIELKRIYKRSKQC